MDLNIRLRKPQPVTRLVETGLRRRVAEWLSAPISDGYAYFTDEAHAARFDRIVKAHSE